MTECSQDRGARTGWGGRGYSVAGEAESARKQEHTGPGTGMETSGLRAETASNGLDLVTMETAPDQGTFYQRGHKPLVK